MEDDLNLSLQSMFLTLEEKTLGLRLKSQSRIYKLFQDCLNNWRFLVTVRNYAELVRRLEVFISALINYASNPFLYGSKKRKKEYLAFVLETQDYLNKANGV